MKYKENTDTAFFNNEILIQRWSDQEQTYTIFALLSLKKSKYFILHFHEVCDVKYWQQNKATKEPWFFSAQFYSLHFRASFKENFSAIKLRRQV